MLPRSPGPIRLVMAPLLGITTSAFRRTFARHFSGLSGAMAPFIVASRSDADPRRLARDVIPRHEPSTLPLVPQIVSNDAHAFVLLANHLRDELGYGEINWNIGCAAGTTPSRLRGAGLLPYPDLVDRFLNDACERFHGKISIKMRLGMRAPSESMALLPILNRYDLFEVCMHPRTGLDRFTGPLNLEAFREFAQGLRHPILFNGDITTSAGALERLASFPCVTGLLLGRGLVANPWLPQAIRDGKEERALVSLSQLRRFHDQLLEDYEQTMEGGAGPILGRMREIWPYWRHFWPEKDRSLRNVLKAKDIASYREAASTLFEG